MSNLPIIPFNSPQLANYSGKAKRSNLRFARPTRGAQASRLGGRFAGLDGRLESPEGLAELRRDPGSIAPERAIVFELAGGDTKKVYTALRNIPGFELLGEDEEEAPPGEGFSWLDNDLQPTDKPVRHRMYFAMPSESALRALLSLWRRYERDDPFGPRYTPRRTAWRDVFDYLHDVRPWGPEDRLPPDVVSGWQEDLRQFPDERHRIEIELWYRHDVEKRRAAGAILSERIAADGGVVLDEREIGDIYYHAMLVELPAAAIRRLADDPSVGLGSIDEVMFLRTQTLSRLRHGEDEPTGDLTLADVGLSPEREPIVALFDGLPLAAHRGLSGRLRLDDPENFAAQYGRVGEQQHGTAMASIILNGDGHAPTPVDHRLYARPVTVPSGSYERFPNDRLAVYALYEAIERMLDGLVDADGAQVVPPSAPRVRIVNLSLGDEKRRYAGIVSPWARLLDYLAFKHRLLFVASAGNIPDEITLGNIGSFAELEDAEPMVRTEAVMTAIFAAKSHRALLSPAEAINVLTVGARHGDNVATSAARGIDPFHVADLPNVSSAMGTGANRCAKPDILVNGGRERLQMKSSRDPVRVVPMTEPGPFFGISAATPGLRGELDRARNVAGTSAATALATNAALRIEAALRSTSGLAIPEDALAVVLKVLMAHSAVWEGGAAELIDRLAQADGYAHWSHRRVETSRFLGLGSPTIERVLGNTKQRALVLGFGEVTKGKGAPYPLPLSGALSGRNEWRGLTATLAWLTPIHCRHGAYRHATLDLELAGMAQGALGVEKVAAQPGDDFGGRGTIIHRRWTGMDPAVFVPDQGVQLTVGCRSQTGGLEGPIPYALAVTLEVGADSEIDVFTEIDARVRAGAPIVIQANGA